MGDSQWVINFVPDGPQSTPKTVWRRPASRTPTLAALNIMQNGGNAIDAAVAAAAVLNVVEPHSTGIGGDVFALFWWAETGELKALNGSGRAPAAATIEEYRRARSFYDALRGCSLRDHTGNGRRLGAVIGRVWTHGLREGTGAGHTSCGTRVFRSLRSSVKPGRGKGKSSSGTRTPPEAIWWTAALPARGDLVRNPALGRTFRILAEGGKRRFLQRRVG